MTSPSQDNVDMTEKPVLGWFVGVSNLSRNVSEAHLKEIFGVYGEMEKICYPMHPISGYPAGKAVIEFANEQGQAQALKCMNGGQIDGNLVNCYISETAEPPRPSHSAHDNRRHNKFKSQRAGGRDDRRIIRPNRMDRYVPDRNQGRHRSRSPVRRDGRGLDRTRGRSPSRSPSYRRRSRSPLRRHSPSRSRSRSPLRRRSPARSPYYARRRSPSPYNSRRRSPIRSPPNRRRSPIRTPPIHRRRSPSRTPPSYRRRSASISRSRSRSPYRRYSPSPSRKRKSLSRSPSPVRARYN